MFDGPGLLSPKLSSAESDKTISKFVSSNFQSAVLIHQKNTSIFHLEIRHSFLLRPFIGKRHIQPNATATIDFSQNLHCVSSSYCGMMFETVPKLTFKASVSKLEINLALDPGCRYAGIMLSSPRKSSEPENVLSCAFLWCEALTEGTMKSYVSERHYLNFILFYFFPYASAVNFSVQMTTQKCTGALIDVCQFHGLELSFTFDFTRVPCVVLLFVLGERSQRDSNFCKVSAKPGKARMYGLKFIYNVTGYFSSFSHEQISSGKRCQIFGIWIFIRPKRNCSKINKMGATGLVTLAIVTFQSFFSVDVRYFICKAMGHKLPLVKVLLLHT